MSTVWSNHESPSCAAKPKLYRYHPNTCPTNTTLIQKPEKILDEVVFDRHVYRENNTNKPVVLLSCLVEFGCESLLPHYFSPEFISKYKNYHKIAVGWRGRNIFYQDYDEFWEINDRFMFLRDYCLAFSNVSKNIRNIENSLKKYGHVIPSKLLGNTFHEKQCKNCGEKELPFLEKIICRNCKSTEFYPSLLEDPERGRKKYVPLKFNLNKYEDWLNEKLPIKPVGIFARNRVTYGRNLPAEFYKNFVGKLTEQGYGVVWLGEKQSTLECPVSNVFDFTKSEHADNLEACLAVVSKCVATFQAWTASTRFSQILDVPYCLIESADQIFGRGQEGKRIKLMTQDVTKSKLIVANYLNTLENLNKFVECCNFNFLDFIENKNSNTVMGIS